MPPALHLRDRAPVTGAPRTLRWFPGPPLRLPAVADRLVEGWWLLTPRARSALTVAAVLAALSAVLLRVILSPYGPPVTVLVANSDLPAGAIARSIDVTTTRWPQALLPTAPPATREDLVGARLTMGVTAGTVLTVRHVRDDGPLADLATGSAAVPIPTGTLRGAQSGVRLDLITVAGDGTGRTIARDVRVLTVEGDTVWLEVARDQAADVSAAVLRGTLSGAVLAR
jgi:Flp pilus assembly protein CpaB